MRALVADLRRGRTAGLGAAKWGNDAAGTEQRNCPPGGGGCQGLKAVARDQGSVASKTVLRLGLVGRFEPCYGG
jgi:hypothetical protein